MKSVWSEGGLVGALRWMNHYAGCVIGDWEREEEEGSGAGLVMKKW